MSAHCGAAADPSNNWNSVTELPSSKCNWMTVGSEHSPPCSGPGRSLDSPRGVTIHSGCKITEDRSGVGCNSTADLSGRIQPSDQADYRRVATLPINFHM